MTHYSGEFRASIAARLLPPNNARVADIVRKTGVPKDTLYEWRIEANISVLKRAFGLRRCNWSGWEGFQRSVVSYNLLLLARLKLKIA